MCRRLIVVGLAWLALVGTACSKGTSTDEGVGPDRVDTTESEATTDATRPVDEDVAPYAELVELSIDDIQQYWEAVYPEVYGTAFEPIPPSRVFPSDEDDLPPPCGDYEFTYDDIVENAFYCSEGDFIAWGDDVFFPSLYEDFGPYTVALVLAHEWGHAVQARAGVSAPSILVELQADCYAGGWTSYVAAGDSPNLELDAAAFEQALAGMLAFRDEPGSDPSGETAHGSAFDRINAFQEGFEQGPVRCAGFVSEPPVVVELPFTSEEEFDSGGNLPLDEVIEATALDLNQFWVAIQDGFVEVDGLQPYDTGDELPTCGGDEYELAELEFAVFFCEADNYVGFHEDLLTLVHREIGDFGVATVLATQWGVSAQQQAGLREDDVSTVSQRACYVGVWAADAALGRADLSLSPGDLDEAVQAILGFAGSGSSLGELSSAFEQVQAFRDGFFSGAARCADYSA